MRGNQKRRRSFSSVDPASYETLYCALAFEVEVEGPVDREHRDGHESHQQRIGLDEVKQASCKTSSLVERDARKGVADGDPHQQGRHKA